MSGVIIDTCMWSLAFRRKGDTEAKVAKEIINLIDENRAKIIGLIRQEVLSGYSDIQSYTKLRDKLRYFPNDFLICAVSARLKMKIYTDDKDFRHYAKYLPVSLHEEN